MKFIRWNESKNVLLKSTRGISFETIVSLIEDGEIVDIRENPNYPNQVYYFFLINDYIYCVPALETTDEIFLKTIFPSRKYNKQIKYLMEKKNEKI